MLLRAFQRNCALNAKFGQQGFDLAIPMVLASRSETNGGEKPAPVPPKEKDMAAVFIQVKNYNGSSLCGAEYERTLDGLHSSIQAVCTAGEPCMGILMQVGSTPIPAKRRDKTARQFVFVRDNVLYVVKPALDTDIYPFMRDKGIKILKETTSLMSNQGAIANAFHEVNLNPQFESNAYADGLDPIGFEG
jgi:hypothetical protein